MNYFQWNLEFSLDLLLNPNSKARRLGYLKLLIYFLKENGNKYPIWKLNKDFSVFVQQYRNALLKYEFQDGEIISTSKSAKPYTDLLLDLGFLCKEGKVYSIVKPFSIQFDSSINTNPFTLTLSEKEILIKHLIEKDGFFFKSSIHYISACDDIYSFSDFCTGFLIPLEIKLENLISNSDKESQQLDDLLKYYLQLKKNKYYLESAILPRLHWYADLGLVTLKETQYSPFKISLTQNGIDFLKSYN